MQLETAVQEYLGQITQTRPWTQPQEEAVLDAFCEWLGQQPARTTLDTVSPIFATSYARDKRLTQHERDEVLVVLHNLCLWASSKGLIVNNPFSLRMMVC